LRSRQSYMSFVWIHSWCVTSCGEVMPPSVEEVKHVVHIADGVAKSGLLATVSGGVVAREVCGFLADCYLPWSHSWLMGATNIMACLCQHSGVTCLVFVHVVTWFFVLASVGAAILFRFC
jgi:hypothetical protein